MALDNLNIFYNFKHVLSKNCLTANKAHRCKGLKARALLTHGLNKQSLKMHFISIFRK